MQSIVWTLEASLNCSNRRRLYKSGMALLPLRLAALAAILAFACYPLYERARLLPILWRSPEKLRETNEFHGHQILYASELRNCEDVMIIPAGEGASSPPYPLALISCDPGRDSWNTVMGSFTENKTSIPDGELWTYMGYDMLDTGDEKEKLKKVEFEHFNASGFHPLGIEYHAPSSTLWVVSHHYDGSRIEMFKLRFEGNQAVARHLRSVTVDSIPAPNAMAAINDHELYVTSDHYFLRRHNSVLAAWETLAGIPGGGVFHVDFAKDQARRVAYLPFANGITFLNRTRLAVASTSTALIQLYDVQPDYSLEKTETIPVDFFPDNLSTDSDGVLYIAGHPSMQALGQLAKDRRNSGVKTTESSKANVPSWVSRWTEEIGLQDLYITRDEFGSSSSVCLDVRKQVGFITGLYERGILMWLPLGSRRDGGVS